MNGNLMVHRAEEGRWLGINAFTLKAGPALSDETGVLYKTPGKWIFPQVPIASLNGHVL